VAGVKVNVNTGVANAGPTASPANRRKRKKNFLAMEKSPFSIQIKSAFEHGLLS
jgi:hypothetical protein